MQFEEELRPCGLPRRDLCVWFDISSFFATQKLQPKQPLFARRKEKERKNNARILVPL